MPPASHLQPRRALVLVPLLVAMLAHAGSMGGEFVYDDLVDIVHHPVVGGDLPWYRVLDFNYVGDSLGTGPNTIRPLTTLSFALEWSLWGPRPWLFDAVTVGWFLLLVLACFRVSQRLLPAAAALPATVVFAALAIHVDATAVNGNRAEVMALTLALFSLLRALDKCWLSAGALYLLAVLSKESAFLLPLVFVCWVVVFEGASRLWQRRRCIAVLVGVAALYLFWRLLFLSLDAGANIVAADNPLVDATWPARLWVPAALLGRYLWLTVAPVSLAVDYSYSVIPATVDLGDAHAWFGMVSIILFAAGLRWSWRRRPEAGNRALAVSLLAFVCSYALFSNTIFLIVTIFAERVFLAPSLWLCMACAAIAAQVPWQPRAVRLGRLLLVTFVVIQVALAWLRGTEYRNPEVLFRSQVAAQPDSVRGHLYLADEIIHSSPAEAVWHFGIAVAGRNAYPKPFRAPRYQEDVGMSHRLRELPKLIAPDTPEREFWPRFWTMANQKLGNGVAPVRDALTSGEDF